MPPDIIHKFIRDKYSKRFPELESLVPNALDYIRTVKVSAEDGPPATTPVESTLLLDPPGSHSALGQRQDGNREQRLGEAKTPRWQQALERSGRGRRQV